MISTVPLKRVTRMAYGDSLATDTRIDGDFPVVGSGGVSGRHNAHNFRAPGIVVGRKGSYGSVHWLPDGGFAIDTAYYIDERFTSADLRWLYYVLHAVDLRGPSQDVGVPGLAREAAYEVAVPVPPSLEEQRRIADFLDAETARIDKLVRLRSEQSALIGEGIAAEAVDLTGRSHIRRGGGTTENMVQLRRAAMSTQTGSTPADLHDLSDGSAPEDNLPWYTPAAIDSWMSIATAEKTTHRDGAPLFPAGSVVITGIGESLGKVAHLNHVATGNQQLTAITPQVGVSGKFIAWQLWAAEQEIREWAQYSRIRIINNDSLKSFPIYLPSRAEQDTVVRTLDSHMVRVRQITDAFLRFQRLADERRQALISAAVTGQFDVSTASGRNVTDGVSA
ncbi:restriction endonuclease subunit S [Streptomyces sp. NBC_00873]|uniref:restriction endonuclease subunit S n=1 Tax=unclassified Streptomyces TaxID=2593676 RepID=UPI00386360E4|nr:restriction endonuclease subunit S [Streptomyces sp. NBC_00873]WTA47554.1 restriction endonuclease subunit S [Streptomyces sp. NBC_00842]